MSAKIVVPELGESVVEATVARWLKQEGEAVKVGEALVELETDKVNVEVAAEEDGVLATIQAQEGEDVKIGDVLGMIEAASANGQTAEKKEEETTTDDEADTQSGQETSTTAEEERVDEAETQAEKLAQTTEPDTEKPKEKVTPVAKRLAQAQDVDLGQVPHDDDDRITKEDVERYLKTQKASPEEDEKDVKPRQKAKKDKQAAAEKKASPAPDRSAREERVRMSRRRQTIARRLVEAQQTAAMLTTFNEIDMSAVMELRRRRQEVFQKQHNIKLGFMSFFVKAVVGALRQFPPLNAEIDGDDFVLKHYYDIGMAIGAEEGLVVPVIREADRLTFAEIEQTIDGYVKKVKDKTLSLEDLRGGTFSITNGGVFGSLLSTPILNPPQVGILGLHKIEKRPVVMDDELVIRPMMYVALSYDHRIVDGREAVQFLVRIKEFLEDPEVLLLEG
jgi:2-oxoglutarate dehydrogenase E2 component (dihydrolipoamide succinyltransferase)